MYDNFCYCKNFVDLDKPVVLSFLCFLYYVAIFYLETNTSFSNFFVQIELSKVLCDLVLNSLTKMHCNLLVSEVM